MGCELERGQRICSYCNVRHTGRCKEEGNLPSLAVSTLEFLQPPQTENQFNRYFGTQGFHDLGQVCLLPLGSCV